MHDLTSPAATRTTPRKLVDSRALVGLLLVLVSVVLGARLVGAADRTTPVLALTRSLPSGTTLRADDLTTVAVHLDAPAKRRYVVDQPAAVVGRVLVRDLGEGELLLVAALRGPDAVAAARLVTVPVDRDHAVGGELVRGDVIDVVATYRPTGQPVVTKVVLERVTVVDVIDGGGGFGGGAGFAVILSVPPADAVTLTAAVQAAELDLLKVVE